MLTTSNTSVSDELARATESLEHAAATCSGAAAFGMIAAALRSADALTATAIGLIAKAMPGGGIEEATGLPTEIALMLEARRTGAEARMLTQAASTLRAMPATARCFARGEVSFGQVRAITQAVRYLDAAGRDAIEHLVGTEAPRLLNADPDELVARVDDAVAALRPDLERAREGRAIETGFLAVQPRLQGGGSFYGEADSESMATMIEALDQAAPPPVDPEIEDAPTRAQQRLQALVTICEASLSGNHSGERMRPRPRLIATVDLDASPQAARLLWSMAGPVARITPLSTEVLSCDAAVLPVFFSGARPVAVGDAQSPIGSALRAALVARNGGCRFPGCGAPVSW